jgi:putative membrane protein
MRRASDLFNEQQRKQVEQTVVEAEAKTSCEIVPVVATVSGRYDRPEDMIGLWLAVIAAVAVWLTFPRPASESGSWDGMPVYVGVFAMVAGVVVAFIVGAVAGSRIGWLRRLFTPRQQMLEEVTSRAREIFFDKRVHHTAGATGLLIYVSLFEHRAVVLGDQELLDKLGQNSYRVPFPALPEMSTNCTMS